MNRALILLALVAACDDHEEPNVRPVAEAPVTAGTTPLRRLNQAEYDNTLLELLQIDPQPSRDWPDDGVTYGFDNVASGLVTTPLHVELHEAAVDALLAEIFEDEAEVTTRLQIQAEGPGPSYTGGEPVDGTAYGFAEPGQVVILQNLVDDGLYQLTVRAWSTAEATPVLTVTLDGETLDEVEVTAPPAQPLLWTSTVTLDDGLRTLEVGLTEALPEGTAGALVIDWVTLEGPLDPETGRSPVYSEIVPCNPDPADIETCASSVVRDFGARAWRRPLTDEDVEDLLSLHRQALDLGLSWYDAVQLTAKAILLSPEFLFHVEAAGEGADADGWTVASRLSYFLWSGPPDEELTTLASEGALADPEVLRAQAARMLADPRSNALVDNFAEQWFGVRVLDSAAPNAETYPEFDEPLRAAMQEEIRLLARDFLLGDRPFQDLFTTRETWVNARLAAHYDLPFEGTDEDWLLVPVDQEPRMGLLTTPGWLLANSDVTRPSAVRRGKWILDNLLCSEIPPPPPDVEANAEPDLTIVQSERDQVETTRTYDPGCTGCHGWMDPIGFSLDHYDGVGAFRSVDALGFPIDASAQLPDGQTFRTAVQLGPLLAADPRVAECAAEKAFIYATGRPLAPEDHVWVADAAGQFAASDYRFTALVAAIVSSPAFRFAPAGEEAR